MFAAYATFYQAPEQLKVTIAGYVEKLAEYPLNVVSAARRRLTDRLTKPPSAGEFKAECERVQFPCGRRPAKAAKDEPLVDPAVAERVHGLMQGLARDLAASSPDPRLKHIADQQAPEDVRQDANRRLAELHADRDKPVALSTEALRAVGVLTDEQEAFLQETLR